MRKVQITKLCSEYFSSFNTLRDTAKILNPLDDFHNQPFDNYDKIIIIRLEQPDGKQKCKINVKEFSF